MFFPIHLPKTMNKTTHLPPIFGKLCNHNDNIFPTSSPCLHIVKQPYHSDVSICHILLFMYSLYSLNT